MNNTDIEKQLSKIKLQVWAAALANKDNPLAEAMLDAHFAQIRKLLTNSNLALLNRLEASSREYSVVDAELFEHRNGQDQELIPLSALQAERNLLEESTK